MAMVSASSKARKSVQFADFPRETHAVEVTDSEAAVVLHNFLSTCVEGAHLKPPTKPTEDTSAPAAVRRSSRFLRVEDAPLEAPAAPPAQIPENPPTNQVNFCTAYKFQ